MRQKKQNFDVSLNSYDLIYSKVKRGEVYICDFGEPFGSEQGYIRYALVIQNDTGNLHSPTTIVLCCTTEKKKNLPVHCNLTFSKDNMVDYNPLLIGTKQNIILGEQIKTIDKRRLRKYLGKMNEKFMEEEIQKIIDISLGLKR